jgi:filamentous hemagglutinin family protein
MRCRSPAFLAEFLVGCLFCGIAVANPQGPQVVHGTASFARPDAQTLNITNSPSAIINWQSFSIAQPELTRFLQQNAASAVLNRVVGQDPSAILGRLLSNGRIFLINPNGLVVGPGAVIDTAGFIGSTLNLTNEAFLSGNLRFEGGPGAGSIRNQGLIKSRAGGGVYLIAPDIENSGVIHTEGGAILLAAGHKLTISSLDLDYISFEVQAPGNEVVNLGELLTGGGAAAIFAGTIRNAGVIRADGIEVDAGGNVVLTASADITLEGSSEISASGPGSGIDLRAGDVAYLDEGSVTRAQWLLGEGGQIDVAARALYQLGAVHADGRSGGTVNLRAENVLQSGTVSADGHAADGGAVRIAGRHIIQTASARVSADGGPAGSGGTIDIGAAGHDGSSIFSSATLAAGGTTGGRIVLTGEDVILRGATIDVSGDHGGGEIYLGGGWQGQDVTIANAARTDINFSNVLNADALDSGDGGTVVVWSDESTRFSGDISARGGAASGDGGAVEVSGKENLIFGGAVDASAPNGEPGMLLLDPKNITVDAAGTGTGGTSAIDLVNPNIGAGDMFPSFTTVLGNGNIVAGDPNDDFAASNAGAIYLYDGTTGALISSLTGSAADDQVGSTPVTQLFSTGNFLVSVPFADVGGTDRGAVVFGDGDSGVSGAISAANALVGGTDGDQIGSAGIQVLFSSGNYLVRSPFADVGGTDRGAVTFGSGTTGVTGVISSSNSLVGGADNDQVGSGSITELFNSGNYLVLAPFADVGGIDRGAVTFGDGDTGVTGVISSTNSLVGGANNDQVGIFGIQVLSSGNYLVKSPFADVGGTDRGAVTFSDGTTGVTGVISTSNSLVGGADNDRVGEVFITTLSSGNYLVRTPVADVGGFIDAGAVTFGSGTTGVTGVISSSNSLVGGATNDFVGNSAITTLSSGNFLVLSPLADVGGTDRGAVTFGDGDVGVSGVVSSSNSLVGAADDDQVGSGGIQVLFSSGNYLVRSPFVDVGGTDRGAVTFGDGTSGVTGVVSSLNSLVGGADNDQVGSAFITTLSTGNYLVPTPTADIGGLIDAGAVTFGSGTSGVTGVVSSSISLVGGADNDRVGEVFITTLSSGNYLVKSPLADIGGTDRGAVTFGDGSTGVTGVISAANSLVGGADNDQVGAVTVLSSSGNYLVRSPLADVGGTDRGAVTFGDGDTGVTGVISSTNSLVGATDDDQIGNFGIQEIFATGNYLVRSPNASVGGTNRGAVTFGDGTTGVSGVVSSSNSLVGGADNDQVGSSFISTLSNGNYVVRTLTADVGGFTNAGAVTFGSGTSGVTGMISTSNSLVGGADNDQVGSGGIQVLFGTGNGNYLVLSPFADVGGSDRGAVTFGDGTAGVTGVVSSSNSLVGGADNDEVGGFSITTLFNGNYLVRTPNADIGGLNDAGAVTFGSGTTGVTGVISASNSLVGGGANDQAGNVITTFSSNNYVVRVTLADIGGVVDAGALTFGDGNTGVSGVISASNSLVGGSTDDQLGSGGVTILSGERLLVRSPLFDNGAVDSGRLQIAAAGTGGGGTPANPPLFFGDNAGSSVTVTPAQITDITNTGTLVTLQASNDLIVNAAIVSDNTGGAGGDLTLQAGRSILINASITSDDGNITLTANDSGAINADRDPGAAVIAMGDGTVLNAGLGNIELTLGTGAGLTNNASGNISLEKLIAQHVAITQNGATAGSSIISTSADALITASSLFIDHDTAGSGGGSIGTAAAPLNVAVNNLSAHIHNASTSGIHIDSKQNVTVGNTFFGQFHLIDGLETLTSGDIVLNSLGNITVAELTDSAGSLTLNAAGALTIDSVTVNAANNLGLSGSAVNIVASTGPVPVSAGGNTSVTTAGELLIKGSDTTFMADAKLNTIGAVTVNAGSVLIQGGAADRASAGIDPTAVNLNVGGALSLIAGAGFLSDAFIIGDSVTATTGGNVLLQGGSNVEEAGIALINSTAGDISIDATGGSIPGDITFTAGTGFNADALLDANSGSGTVTLTFGNCFGCVSATPSTSTEAGIFASVINLIQVEAPPATVQPETSDPTNLVENDLDNLNSVLDALATFEIVTADEPFDEEGATLECRIR